MRVVLKQEEPSSGRKSAYDDIMRKAQSFPAGEWVALTEYKSPKLAYSMAGYLRKKFLQWEFKARKLKVYARQVIAGVQTTNTEAGSEPRGEKEMGREAQTLQPGAEGGPAA